MAASPTTRSPATPRHGTPCPGPSPRVASATWLAAVCLLLPGCLLLVACGSIDPEPPLDDDGNPLVLPPPYETWLQISAMNRPSGDVSLQPDIAITFSDYLDPTTFYSWAFVGLQSGGIVVRGDVDYVMTTRTVHFRPARPLEPDLRYTIIVDGANLRSVTGAPFLPLARYPTLIARAHLEPTPVEPAPDVRYADIAPILEARCASCHADPAWHLNPLTPESLVGAPSEQSPHLLVRPFDPSRSYLMHKILPDYPLRRFTVQPPPWSDDPAPLSQAERLLIERWIRQGARK